MKAYQRSSAEQNCLHHDFAPSLKQERYPHQPFSFTVTTPSDTNRTQQKNHCLQIARKLSVVSHSILPFCMNNKARVNKQLQETFSADSLSDPIEVMQISADRKNKQHPIGARFSMANQTSPYLLVLGETDLKVFVCGVTAVTWRGLHTCGSIFYLSTKRRAVRPLALLARFACIVSSHCPCNALP